MDLLFRLNKDDGDFNTIDEARYFFKYTLPKENKNRFFAAKKYPQINPKEIIYFSYGGYLVAKASFTGEIFKDYAREGAYNIGHELTNIQIIDSDKKLNNMILRNNTMYLRTEEMHLEIKRILETPLKDSLLDDIEGILGNNTPISTESRNSVKCRIGQGGFRDSLIDYWGGCAITKLNKHELLIASHIQPWSVSTDEERLDVYNGLLLTPNLDKLFDKGYISFKKDGKILISDKLDDYSLLGVEKNMTIHIRDKHEKYLDYHRDKIFMEPSL